MAKRESVRVKRITLMILLIVSPLYSTSIFFWFFAWTQNQHRWHVTLHTWEFHSYLTMIFETRPKPLIGMKVLINSGTENGACCFLRGFYKALDDAREWFEKLGIWINLEQGEYLLFGAEFPRNWTTNKLM